MRKVLLTVCILLSCVIASIAQEDSYKIEGQLDKSVNGRLKLVANTEKGMIELGDVMVTNGVFVFTGRMPEVTLTYLIAGKNSVLAAIMLENAHYTISMGTNELIVEGGEAQKIWREFNDLSSYLLQNGQKLEAQARKSGNGVQIRALQQEYKKIETKVYQEEVALLKTHSDTYVAAYVVASKLQGAIAEERLNEYYGLLGENAKATIFGKQVAEELAKMQKLAVGAVAPNFSAALSDGGVLSLHETKAKVKIVDFWASWCGPCRRENVNLLNIYKRFRPRGLEIISVSTDTNKHAWLAAIGQDGSTWKNVSDLKQISEIGALYSVKAIPCTFILDEENRIVAKNLRGKELEKKVAEMLKKKK